jgi:hypothetical protein
MGRSTSERGMVFVSYGHPDKPLVEPLVNYLASQGLVVLWDEYLTQGAEFRPAIQKAIEQAACVVVVWTPKSVRSRFVRGEATLADGEGILRPVVMGKHVRIPVDFNELSHTNLTGWRGGYDPRMAGLLRRIRRLVAHPPRGRTRWRTLSRSWDVQAATHASKELRGLASQLESVGQVLASNSAATEDLHVAFREIAKTYDVVNEAIIRFIAPAAGRGAPAATPYLRMERGALVTAIENGRGHCGRISAHYFRHGGLRQALQSRMQPARLAKVDGVFTRLGTADGDLFAELGRIGDVLTGESRAIARILLVEDHTAARRRILAVREKLAPLEKELARAMRELQRQQQAIGYAAPTRSRA